MSSGSPIIRLAGLGEGEHFLTVAAVDAAGNSDPQPRLLRWTTRAAVAGAEAEPCAGSPSPALMLAALPSNASTTAEFRFCGWSKDLFLWRLNGGDGGQWNKAEGMSHLTLSVAPGQPHVLEFMPGGVQGLWSAPPGVFRWSVFEGSNALALDGLSEGAHRLAVRAVDAAGNVRTCSLCSCCSSPHATTSTIGC